MQSEESEANKCQRIHPQEEGLSQHPLARKKIMKKWPDLICSSNKEITKLQYSSTI